MAAGGSGRRVAGAQVSGRHSKTGFMANLDFAEEGLNNGKERKISSVFICGRYAVVLRSKKVCTALPPILLLEAISTVDKIKGIVQTQ